LTTRSRWIIFPLAVLLLLVAAASASARPVHLQPPAQVKIGRVALGHTAKGHPAILLPITYPIQFAGRHTRLEVTLLNRRGGLAFSSWVEARLDAGRRRRPERRRRFVFVHSLDIGARPPVRLEQGMRVRVAAKGWLDVNGDGKPELKSHDRASQWLPLAPSRKLCSTLGARRTRPGRRLTVRLPACTKPRRWRIVHQPPGGQAHLEGSSLVYRPDPGFRRTDALTLSGGRQVHITVGTAGKAVVRALGDSVTAGFGYYSNGTPMTIGRLLGCRPSAKEFDDACSSNSLVTANTQKLVYAPDYGLANNISWAAQWANEHGVTDYENLAVSGSEPGDWAPNGELHRTTEQIEAEDPDYILMTIGANPLLSNMLFGLDNMGCAVESDITGGYRECIEEAFAEVHLRENLKSLYEDLVAHTDATIYLMQYHLAVPSTALAYSATQIAEMGQLLNGEIAAVAAAVNPQRLVVVTPPHFNVGIDISPVYPSTFTCSRLGYTVDGPSVQSAPTQKELAILHPLSFCKGPDGGGPPWVISGDTGIHPSAAGYEQMAAQVPPPAG
jgi:lysophospholipase L1-like esterase